MALFIFLAAVILLTLCLLQGEKRTWFIGVIVAILCFPICLIFALAKKYK